MKLISVRIEDRSETSADSCSFILSPESADQTLSYQPGQYLSLKIPLTSGPIFRSYSFSSCPGADEPPRITVKREPGGRGSNWLCDHLKVGDTLDVLPPAGDFGPENLSRPLLLIAGGSGITPILSLMKAALLHGNPAVSLIYANRDSSQVIHGSELDDWQNRYPEQLQITHWLDEEHGRPTASALARTVQSTEFATACLCGPAPFMATARAALLSQGVAPEQILEESFSPTADTKTDPVESGDAEVKTTLTVTLNGEEHAVNLTEDQYLLDAMIGQGLNVPSSCRAGNCGTCLCTLTEGSVILDGNTVLDDDDLEEGWTLACRARPISGRIRIVFP